MGASIVALLATSAQLSLPTASAADPVDCSSVAWMDKSKTADERAAVLLAASTLDQKLRWLNEHSANDPARTTFTSSRPRDLPATTPFTPVTFTMPEQVACTPLIAYADGPEFVSAGGGVTYFPAPIANAAAWSTDLSLRKGAAQADEAWRKSRNVLLAPGLASGRTPLSGRTSEYLGEDPLLTGLIAGAASIGINSNPAQPVEAELKHFVANEQETDRNLSSSNMDERTLREIYTLPFEIAIDRGDVDNVMCAFNAVNNDWSCGSKLLLDRILKTEIGFKGYVVTDFGSVHKLTDNPPSLRAGLDQELNAWREWTPMAIKDQIAVGRLREADVDEAAFRVVRSHISAGLFDVAKPAVAEAIVTTAAHKLIAQEVAEKGTVLLKNDDVLPLGGKGKGKKIAVIGPTAANTPLAGDVDASTVCTYGRATSPSPSPCIPVSPLEGITARASAAGDTVAYNDGIDLAAAAAAAQAADVVIVFGYYREGEFADRPTISLDGNGDALVSAVAAANTNTVVVLQTGGPVLMPWLDSVKGVLETWYAGEQMGPAIARILYGDVSPTGKLPMTFPKSEADLPTAGDPQKFPGTFDDGSTVRTVGSVEIRQIEFKEGLKVGYRWYASQGIKPLFPFGYGLSYTRFEYDKLQVTPTTSDGSKDVRVRLRLANTGKTAGTETAQAYVQLPSSTGEPSKRLVGWQQVTLAPGESKNVEITLTAADLADLHLLQYWDYDSYDWQTADGTYGISVGSSFDTKVKDTFRIKHAD